MLNTTLKAVSSGNFTKNTLSKALLLSGKEQQSLFELARSARAKFFPDAKVETRSVIELSNICRQRCNFCAIGSAGSKTRYTLPIDTILKITAHIYRKKRRVLLLQSGESASQAYIDVIVKCVSEIKNKFNDLTVILCMGNLLDRQYSMLKHAGADRYILKFETSNPALYKIIKPRDSLKKRVKSYGR